MQAFHSFWSAPAALRDPEKEPALPDFELLTSILSALEWKKHNGPIRLITDTPGLTYFRKLGMDGLWDETDLSLDSMDSAIDPFLFWAAGKMAALKSMPAPCVMLDTDLIIWKNLDSLWRADLAAAHPELLNPDVYPDPYSFKLKEDYHFHREWDFTLDAANTAFLYIKDGAFKDYYAGEALRFFTGAHTECFDTVTGMCFAEQRLLPVCAKEKGKKISYLLSLDEADAQDTVTHTWGFKQLMREVPKARWEFCMRMTSRIMEEFPDKEHLLSENPILSGYLKEYLSCR